MTVLDRMPPLVLAIAMLLSGGNIQAADWRDFRGPGGQGHAVAHDLPVELGETTNLTWKTRLPGIGWSSPVVCAGQIWMTTATDDGHSLRVLCVDFNSGRLVHDIEVLVPDQPAPINSKNSYASPSPVIEPGRVYVNFGTMGTACVDTSDGKVVWTNTTLHIEHKEGPGSSPILFDDFVIMNFDGMDAQFVVAYDKFNGKVVWRTDRTGEKDPKPDFRKAYSTPLLINVNGTPQLLSTGAHQIVAYDPRDGAELWKNRYNGFSNVPRPVYQDGVTYFSTGFQKPELWAVRVDADARGDLTDTHVLWKFNRQVPANSSPILVRGRIYMASDRGVATCVDAATGTAVWQDRQEGNYSASPIYADGKLYFSSEQGQVTVFKPKDELKPLAVNQLNDRLMASPAVVGKSLIFRTEKGLWRFDKAIPGS